MTELHPLPPVTADERTTLEQFLDYFRSVLVRKADGIDEAQARQQVGVSAMDMLGLVRHMALVEQWWFSQAFVLGGIASALYLIGRFAGRAVRTRALHPWFPAADPAGESLLGWRQLVPARLVLPGLVLVVAAAAMAIVALTRGDPDRRARLTRPAALAGSRGDVGESDDVGTADLVVNATSVGMGVAAGADGPLPVDADLLRPGQVVVDLVYQPLETPLLRAARAAGAHPVDGLGMLVHQAALSIRRWTGADPDLAAMSLAARQR